MSDRESPLQRRVTDALKYSSRRLSDYRLQCHQIITWKFSFHDLIKSLTNHKTSRGVVVITTAQLIQLSLNSGSAQVQILFAAVGDLRW